MQHTASKTPGLLSFFKHVALAFLLSATLPAQAQTDEEVPNYTLEVIVFETFALKSWTEEYWPEDVAAPDSENTLNLQDLLNGTLKSPVVGNKSMAVKNVALALNNEAAKLTPQRGYRILFHQAWTQNTVDDVQMPKLWIDNSASNNSGSILTGTVKLYKSRYAHVDFDLELERRIPDRIRDEFIAHEKLDPTGVIPNTWRFKLEESRKIRPGQLHYIDHPQFGVLVQLTYNGPAK
ncbi:CsiV family protein [Thiomicrorhabdus cannonii]|uniref:CsiV family protein n=1 Tax=Thiomicrorhabdus cannonii TaxID=2748011 RepID=UPI0015BC7F60|nr:CsiV family protein [Thiomicrorhabdus cannonii]